MAKIKSNTAVRKQGVIDSLEKILSLAEDVEKQAKRFTESLASSPEWLPVQQQAFRELEKAESLVQSAQQCLSQAWQMIHRPDEMPEIHLGRPPYFPEPHGHES